MPRLKCPALQAYLTFSIDIAVPHQRRWGLDEDLGKLVRSLSILILSTKLIADAHIDPIYTNYRMDKFLQWVI